MKDKTDGNVQKKNSLLGNEKDLEERRISFSSRLVDYLEDEKKEFNKRNKSSIKIQQLKEVYARGTCITGEDLNLCGLSRVHMFLRMKEQKKMKTKASSVSVPKKASELVLEDQAPQKTDSLIDISDSWIPEEEDIEKAKACIKEHDLNFDFKNINELYLESYKRIQLNWE
jgi:hypothetical protein